MVEISRRNPGECIEGSKVGLYKANGKALKTTGRDE